MRLHRRSHPGRWLRSASRALARRAEPVQDRVGRLPWHFQLRHVPNTGELMQGPGGVGAGGRARCGDRYQAVLGAVNQQHRAGDHAEPPPVGPAMGVADGAHDGAHRRGEVALNAREPGPLDGHLDMLGDYVRRDRATRRSPGVRYSANMAVTTGSGRAATTGRAGSRSTRPATEAGAPLASSREIMPPMELPMRITGPPVTDRMNRCSSPRFEATSVPRPRDWVRPCPARSGASTRHVPVSSGAIAVQFTAEPPSPWTQTMTGPSAGPPKSKYRTGPPRSVHREIPADGDANPSAN